MNDYSQIRKLINTADAIIIGAGAGLSTSAGIDYGSDNFKKKFPEKIKKYHMTDMYTSSFYEFATEEERWSYWAKHINYIYNPVLLRIKYLKSKEHSLRFNVLLAVIINYMTIQIQSEKC